MSDQETGSETEFDELTPLPELPEEAELEEVEELEELEELPVEGTAPPAPAVPRPAPRSGGGRSSRGERQRPQPKKKNTQRWERWTGEGEKPKREMEAAPKVLRKAALGLFIGSLLPWGGLTPDWGGNIVEKLLVIFGLYVWHQTHLLRDGAKVPGFIGKLGAKNFVALFVLAGACVLIGFAPVLSMASLGGENASEHFGPFAEKGLLILAGLSMTHIYDYEHGGRFNPMYPLMFLAPGIAGLMALLKVFSAPQIGLGQMVGGLGAVAVGVAGWMAAYTMYVALKEAKSHGDAKKAAQLEARKAARKARR